MRFSFAGRTMDYFGSKAITSDVTALFELIKNSRDANATKVTVHFENTYGKNSSITVSDDGDGMSEAGIREKWMVIGTDARLRSPTTKNGKPVWGEMGIGRMACQKLGGMTELISTKDEMQTAITFDWSLFDNSNVTVDGIDFRAETAELRNAKSGLVLKIKNLKSEWTPEKIRDLKRELGILIMDDALDGTTVSVKVGDGGEEAIGRDYAGLQREVTAAAPFKLEAVFDGRRLAVRIMTQVGQRGKWEEQDDMRTRTHSPVGPFTASIYHFPRAPGKERSSLLERYYGNRIGAGKLELFLKKNHGLYIYRDGAWMRPYGGEMDWLSLEAGARQETRKIGIKQIFGQVILTKKDNPGIKPASHRETLIENDAFMSLKEMMGDVFVILQNYMSAWKKCQIREPKKPGNGEPSGSKDGMESVLGGLERAAASGTLTPHRIRAAVKEIRDLRSAENDEADAMVERMHETKKHVDNLATVGIATSFMARHVTGPLERNMEIAARVSTTLADPDGRDKCPSEDEMREIKDMLAGMRRNQNQMLHFIKFVSVLARHTAQSINRDEKHAQINVGDCWRTVSDGFEDRQRELNVKVTSSHVDTAGRRMGKGLTVKADRIDLECILTHLYLNSIESLRGAGDRKGSIACDYSHSDRTLTVEVYDNGRGIPSAKLEEIFEPFRFGRSVNGDDMHGHGLGLYIVRRIAESYSGTAEALDVRNGAKIRVVLRDVPKVAG